MEETVDADFYIITFLEGPFHAEMTAALIVIPGLSAHVAGGEPDREE